MHYNLQWVNSSSLQLQSDGHVWSESFSEPALPSLSLFLPSEGYAAQGMANASLFLTLTGKTSGKKHRLNASVLNYNWSRSFLFFFILFIIPVFHFKKTWVHLHRCFYRMASVRCKLHNLWKVSVYCFYFFFFGTALLKLFRITLCWNLLQKYLSSFPSFNRLCSIGQAVFWFSHGRVQHGHFGWQWLRLLVVCIQSDVPQRSGPQWRPASQHPPPSSTQQVRCC